MRFYEDPTKTSEGRMPPRAYCIPKGAKTDLNGEWRFHFFARDIDYTDTICEWDTIPVPSCWQTKGYEAPNYTNSTYPLPCDPPYVPDENPCGVYERSFTLSEITGKIYYVLEGVSSCATVYVNGKKVGYTQGSHLIAEFDITDFVKIGENTLRVVVLKWCCGTYLEDQDQFRYNGIFRDTYLLTRPTDHLTDFSLSADTKSIKFSVDKPVNLTVKNAANEVLASVVDVKSYTFTPENPILWNAEQPYLYTVAIECAGEYFEKKVGMRSIAISSSAELLINGVSVKLKGVNRHDTHPTEGWTVTREDIRKELALMKELNINCIRTSHYPPTDYMLDLCDELGFYVIHECDIETHGFNHRVPGGKPYDVESYDWPTSNQMWENEFIDRIKRGVLSARNHSSIIIWSTGNESGYGNNHRAQLKWLASLGDGRLHHNENAARAGIYEDTDMISGMYYTFKKLTDIADKYPHRPVFLCEYSHAMGNGPGDVWDYVELFYSRKNLIGGCVWEWADHTFIKDGVPCYGGDFEGEMTHGGNFCCDGMVFHDRSLKAGSLEVQAAYQPLATQYQSGSLTLTNRYDFTPLEGFELVCNWNADGKTAKSEHIPLSLAPHESITLPACPPAQLCRYGLTLECLLIKEDKTYARTVHEIPAVIPQKPVSPAATVTERGEHILFTGERFTYTFSKTKGSFVSIVADGKEQLKTPMALTLWRALTDNDLKMSMAWGVDFKFSGSRTGENLNKLFHKVYDCTLIGDTLLMYASIGGVSRRPIFRYTLALSVTADGAAHLTLDGTLPETAPWLPRLGYEWQSAETAFSYYGYGPTESYRDMHHGATRSLWQSSAADEYVPYIRPQEHGNHYGCKMLSIGALTFTAATEFEIKVSDISPENLNDATHQNEVVHDEHSYVRLDYKGSGIGSHSCGPQLNEKYRLDEKEIHFDFTISI